MQQCALFRVFCHEINRLCHIMYGIFYFMLQLSWHSQFVLCSKGGPISLYYDTFDTKYRAGNFTNTDSNINPYRHKVAIIICFHIRTWTKHLSDNLSILISMASWPLLSQNIIAYQQANLYMDWYLLHKLKIIGTVGPRLS